MSKQRLNVKAADLDLTVKALESGTMPADLDSLYIVAVTCSRMIEHTLTDPGATLENRQISAGLLDCLVRFCTEVGHREAQAGRPAPSEYPLCNVDFPEEMQ